ncbi:MAG: tryptophan--tRNA ligase [Chloroflexota bacterium]|nr:MAG: tryptophan--tRNA ligase [Chloroflexota bacterium]
MSLPARPRTFSGIKPTGVAHLGNYLGAMKRWVDEQDEYDNIYCVVDLHGMTEPFDPAELRRETRGMFATLLAVGLDPDRCVLFAQSHVHEHAELCWILNCITPVGWLERMTQFKDKSRKQSDRERISAGLLDYPVLMAADIILYDAHVVPVGEDQKQHVELTRDIAARFNRVFGDTFVVPEPRIQEAGARIMGLDDPTRKMSKSDDAPNRSIFITDEPDAIRRKIARAATDSRREIRFDPERAGLFNLLTILQVITNDSNDAIERRYEGKGYGDLKRDLADAVVAHLAPIQERYRSLMANPDDLDREMARGAERAAAIARPVMARVRKAVGLA